MSIPPDPGRMGKRARRRGSSETKLCECGCGLPAPIAKQSETKRGYVKGEPLRYRSGHGNRGKQLKPLETQYIVRDCGYDTPCWVWQGGTNDSGYGRIKWRGRMRPAHRAYLEVAGVEIPEGMVPDHLCFNPTCVNPAHLEIVTPRENVRRQRNIKLSLADVEAIRTAREQALDAARDETGARPQRLAGGNTLRRELAVRYGVHPDYIKQLWRYERCPA